jgi:hypothetical protein
LRGRVRIIYADGEELIEPGNCFYLPGGHLPKFEEDSEWIMFSPRNQHKQTAEAVRRNKAEMDRRP